MMDTLEIFENPNAECHICKAQAHYKSGFDHYLCEKPKCHTDYVQGYMDQFEFVSDMEQNEPEGWCMACDNAEHECICEEVD
jgi:hypothetical protein